MILILPDKLHHQLGITWQQNLACDDVNNNDSLTLKYFEVYK